MLLVLSNSSDATASYLTTILANSGVTFFRLDTDTALPALRFSYRQGCPALWLGSGWIKQADVSTIWYRRPESLTHSHFDETPEGRFALKEWTEALEGFFTHVPRTRWMNHPGANAAASNKLEQLTTALALGFQIPETLVTQDQEELRRFFGDSDGRVIVKPMGVGYVERSKGEGDSLIYTNRVSAENLNTLEDLSLCPTLFQRCISKQADVRITVVDDEVHAISLSAKDSDGLQRCDIRRNNMADVTYTPIQLPSDVSTRIRMLMEQYGLRFAAIDMAIATTGEWVFFEVNPNGQWAWLDIAGASNIAASFVASFRANN